jgi:hypothetical protein
MGCQRLVNVVVVLVLEWWNNHKGISDIWIITNRHQLINNSAPQSAQQPEVKERNSTICRHAYLGVLRLVNAVW